VNTLTAGYATAITNDKGSITVSSTGDPYARGHANGAYNQANIATTNADAAFTQANTATTLAQTARDHANGAFGQANSAALRANTLVTDNVPETTTNLYFTAARVRANISNTAPINYNSTTGTISHADSGVVATTYGNASFVSQVTVDARGHITSVSNVAIDQTLAQGAYNQANSATTTGQAAFDKANGAIYTAAQIRANITNTAPINYDASTGTVSHAASGVSATGYGLANSVPTFVVNATGHVTSASNTAIAIDASQVTSGTLAVGRGGTGQTAAAIVNGAVLIGNTVSGGYDLNRLSAGPNIIITNDKGSITIEASSGSSTDQFARDRANGAFAQANIATTNADAAFANANTAIYTAAQIRANISNAYPVYYNQSTGVVSFVPATANGQLLIGNTVSGTFDVNTLTQGTGITITNDKGAITIAATGGSAIDQYARDTANGAFVQANSAALRANTLVTDNVPETTTNLYFTAARVRANVTNAFPVSYNSGTGTFGLVAANSNGKLLISNTIAGTYDSANLTAGYGIIITQTAGGIQVDSTTGRTYYLILTQASDIATHNVAYYAPSANAEVNTSIVHTGTGFSLHASFITNPGDPGTALLPAGTYGRHFHATTDGPSNEGQIRVELYKYLTNAAEILLRTNDSPVFTSGSASDLLTWNITDSSSYPLEATDRLLWKVYARRVTGGSGSVRVTIYYEGSARASYFPTTIQDTGRDIFARQQANAAFAQANAAYANANTAIYTAAQIRANISNSYPVYYNQSTGVVSFVPATANGQLLIGNTVSGSFDVNTLTAGYAMAVTNDKGSITVASTGDQFARDAANGAYNRSNHTFSFVYSDTPSPGTYTDWATLHAAYVAAGSPNTTIGFHQHIANSSNWSATGNSLVIPSGTWTFASGTKWASVASEAPTWYYPIIKFAEGSRIIGVGEFDFLTLSSNTPGPITMNAAAQFDGSFATLVKLRNCYTQGTSAANCVFTTFGYGDTIELYEKSGFGPNSVNVNSGDCAIYCFGAASSFYPTALYSANAQSLLTLFRADSGLIQIIQQTQFAGTLTVGNLSGENYGASNPTYPANGHMFYNNTLNVPLWYNSGWGRLVTGNVPESATNLYFTAARVRANISNTTPINYDSTTGIISHATSGVTATGHGDAATIPTFIVNATGHVTSVTNTAIAISASQVTSGTLAVGRGGTGQTAASLVNGAVLIGNTVSGGYDLNTLTQGSGIVITNDKGSITIAATGGAAIDQYARDTANGSFAHANGAFAHANGAFNKANAATPNTATANGQIYAGNTVSGQFDLTTIAQTAPVIVTNGRGTITLSHASSGVTATGYGDAATLPLFVVDQYGHVTSVTNTAIAIAASQVTSGTLAVSRGGTGRDGTGIVNGSLLIGNTVSGGYDIATLTQGTNITITNDKGSITITAAGGGGSNFGTITVSGQSDVVADQTNDTLTLTAGTDITITTDAGTDTITFTHATSGVTATGHGDAATIPVFIVNSRGHVTSVTNTAVAIAASQITSGTLGVTRGGTGVTGATANGQLLIGNTVSGGFDLATLTQGTNITITNDKGSITIAAAGGGGSNFGTITVSGQSDVVADQTNDTLTLVAGESITITTDAGTDTVTLAAQDAFARLQANNAYNHANGAFGKANTANDSTQGLHSIWIPAYAMYPQTTNGASPANTVQMVTNLQILKTLDFDTTTSEAAQFAVKMPNSWNAGTVTANAVWSHGTTVTNFGVTWQIDALSYGDNEAIDTAFSGAVSFSDTGGTANTVYISPASAAITIASTPAKGDWVVFRVRREVANASDTMAIDARLHGVELKFTTNANHDA
jgi:hypothetical protein